jgi:hypothetical protein
MTKRTKKVGVTGKYGTRYVIESSNLALALVIWWGGDVLERQRETLLCWQHLSASDAVRVVRAVAHRFTCAIQIWCLSPKASQEDGNHTTREIRMHILRKNNSEASLSGNLDLQGLQEDCSWRSIHSVVRLSAGLQILERHK